MRLRIFNLYQASLVSISAVLKFVLGFVTLCQVYFSEM